MTEIDFELANLRMSSMTWRLYRRAVPISYVIHDRRSIFFRPANSPACVRYSAAYCFS
jgi:hypothetical protein